MIWNFRVCNKFAQAVKSAGQTPCITGGGWLCWTLIGWLLFGLGPLIAFVKQVHSWNDANKIYNGRHLPAGQ